MASSQIPPMPGSNDGSMSGLMQPTGDQPQPAQPDIQERAQTAMRRIRTLMTEVENLSREYPASAKSARPVSTGLKDMMVAIVQDINQGQGSQPQSPSSVA